MFPSISSDKYICAVILLIISFIFTVNGQDVYHKEGGIESLSMGWSEQKRILKEVYLIKNDNGLVPLQDLYKKRMAVVSLGQIDIGGFRKMADRYKKLPYIHIDHGPQLRDNEVWKDSLSAFDVLIWCLDMGAAASIFSSDIGTFVHGPRHVVIAFNSPPKETLPPLNELSSACLLARNNKPITQELTAQFIFGGISHASDTSWNKKERLSFGSAASFGWNDSLLHYKVDSIMHHAISEGAFPGGQLLMAVKGKVILHKTYGYHTYDSLKSVQWDDVYDLASITKISGPLPMIMKLVEEEKIYLDDPMSKYWKDFQRKDKRGLTWKEILAHQSGLQPYIVYWEKTVKKKGAYKKKWYSTEADENYSIEIQPNLYLSQDFTDRIFKAIRKSKVEKEPSYVYSGLSFLIFPSIISGLNGASFEEDLYTQFYRPLGADLLGYRPAKRLPLDRIVPTEWDSVYRKQLVNGYVHDEAAAMFNGVSGNAGLFSNANDLAKLMQMYVQMGQYAGRRYIADSVVDLFTSYQYPEQQNRRGLGFDKPLLEERENGYIAPEAGRESFGHSGFTGTFAWADREEGKMIILLTNRVYPSRKRRKLYELNIRPSLHSLMYHPEITGEKNNEE